MALAIFLVSNGAGVIFLLYVLANFWEEGRRPQREVRQYTGEIWGHDKPEMIITTHSISPKIQCGVSVISLQDWEDGPHGSSVRPTTARGIVRVPVKRTSAR